MTVIVAGPEGSGTNMLTDLLRACGIDAVQRSLPYAGVWWMGEYPTFDPVTWEPYEDGVRFVVITRHAYPTVMSTLRRRLVPDPAVGFVHQSEAVRHLKTLDATRVMYEDIVADPRGVIGGLAAILGGTLPDTLPEVRDENAKWGTPAP